MLIVAKLNRQSLQFISDADKFLSGNHIADMTTETESQPNKPKSLEKRHNYRRLLCVQFEGKRCAVPHSDIVKEEIEAEGTEKGDECKM